MTTALTDRDKKLLGLFVVVLMVGSLGLWFPKAKVAWQMQEMQAQRLEAQYTREQNTIALQPLLQEKYDALQAQMPIFPEGKSVDTYWLPIMDNTARANNVNIAQRSIGGEIVNGEVTELTLECRDWEANLESLVWFLYDIEARKDAMMDVRAITIRPSPKKPGVLQGTFTINCAYMRQPAE